LGAEVAFFQRADAVACQVIGELLITLGLACLVRVCDEPVLVVLVESVALQFVLYVRELCVLVIAIALEQIAFRGAVLPPLAPLKSKRLQIKRAASTPSS
jgi:hypothetical protein